MPNYNFIDLTNSPPFGRWTVLSQAPKATKGRQARWHVRCECGTLRIVSGKDLRSGHSRSCGCLNGELSRARSLIHGMAKGSKRTPTLEAWRGMIRRCTDPHRQEFIHYGQRGITVCNRWRKSFLAFLKDMGERPGPQFSLERRKNYLGYSPKNCCWATKQQQMNNRRNNHLITYHGKTQTLAQWAEQLKMNSSTLRMRLQQYGWSKQKALSTPVLCQKARMG